VPFLISFVTSQTLKLLYNCLVWHLQTIFSDFVDSSTSTSTAERNSEQAETMPDETLEDETLEVNHFIFVINKVPSYSLAILLQVLRTLLKMSTLESRYPLYRYRGRLTYPYFWSTDKWISMDSDSVYSESCKGVLETVLARIPGPQCI